MHSVIIAYLLWFFGGMGCLGLHRHYLGKHPTGFLWMFTGGMASKGFCEMRVTSAGAVVYRFADFSTDAKASLEL